jgi:hypothetical protein
MYTPTQGCGLAMQLAEAKQETKRGKLSKARDALC